jgi:aspartate-semialdehyde dehydrogenase
MSLSGRGLSVAVVGATGAVGEVVLAVLAERNFPIAKLHALGSGTSADDTVMFAERPQPVRAVADFDFKGCDLAIFCAPAAVAAEHAPRAAAAGCLVIDASRQFRQDSDVPLVVPEINASLLAQSPARHIVASPSAAAVQLASVLAPIQRAAGLTRIDVTTLLAVSDRGRAGVSELAGQTARLLNAQSVEQRVFPAQIAFNLMPQFDALAENGYTLDELGVAVEVKKLLADEQLVVETKNLYAPVFYGHSQTVFAETRQPLSAAAARKLLAKTPGLKVMDRAADHLSPVGDSTGEETVMVGPIRQSLNSEHGLSLWIVADNIRKGAAVNIVQIAEALIKSHL